MPTILHLIDGAGPGGAETVYLNLATSLESAGWRSLPVVPTTDWLTEQLLARGQRPILDVCRNRFDWRYLSRMVRLVRRESVDLIHAHLFGPGLEASILALLTGVPAVCTLHGRGDLSPGERLRDFKFRLLNRGASRVVFVSGSLREHFLAQGPLRHEITEVIPNGIDVSRHAHRPALLPEDLEIPADRFVVGAVGNLRPVKRYDVLLRAAAILRDRSPDYYFVVVGQAPARLHAELLALRDSLGLRDFVRFTGFRDDVERALSNFDLFALTSDSEGFSIATVQAMASELPIVSTRCGGPEEILEDGRTGVLVPPGSPEDVADAIHWLRGRRDIRVEFGRAAREVALARFSLEAQVHSYEALYEDVLTRGRRARVAARIGEVDAATAEPLNQSASSTVAL